MKYFSPQFSDHKKCCADIFTSYVILRCLTPPRNMTHATELVMVDLESQLYEPNMYITDDDIHFLYIKSYVISSISPDHGPISGGTRVTIYGYHFFNTPDLVTSKLFDLPPTVNISEKWIQKITNLSKCYFSLRLLISKKWSKSNIDQSWLPKCSNLFST